MKQVKKCTKCGEVKPLEAFSRNRKASDGKCSTCKVCQYEYSQRPDVKARKRECRLHPDRKARERAHERQTQIRMRRAAMERIGGMRCVFCGCEEQIFLTIDHADGNGTTHRKQCGLKTGEPTVRWLLKVTDKELAKWNLRVLCFNCNLAFSHHTEAVIKAAAERDLRARIKINPQ